MLLFEPPPSQGDIHFRLFGFPVRIHPYFWVMAVVMGLNPKGGTRPEVLLVWVGVVFVSILVHELGHAFVQRYYGGRPWITLYAVGGLASCDDCDRRPASQILISLAGPAAGFLLAAAVAGALAASGYEIGLQRGPQFDFGKTHVSEASVLEFPLTLLYWQTLPSNVTNLLVSGLLQVNILWGLVNLLPIYPLDGGRISREACTSIANPRRGTVLSLQISMYAAGAMAIFAAISWGSLYSALLFGYLSYSSFRALRAYQGSAW